MFSFDADYYQEFNPDIFTIYTTIISGSGTTWPEFAQSHYETTGAFEGRDPNPYFDTSYYLETYTDVAAAGVEPLQHFVDAGSLELRFPNANLESQLESGFDAASYAAANPDIVAAGLTTDAELYQHWVLFGAFEGRPGAQNGNGEPIVLVEIDAPICFAAGTRIRLQHGDRAVEDLSVGDLILTFDGRCVPVMWVGRQTLSARLAPPERLRPVRIAASALGNGVPSRDLTLTADHALLIGDVLVNAGALVNGSSVYRVPLKHLDEFYTVYHVETEGHEIILAEGVPAETFIDSVSRRAFDNYAEFEALYGDNRDMVELPLPRAVSARQVPDRVRRMVVAEARAA